MCDLCDRFEIEDARHLILHCSFFHNSRTSMFESINEVEMSADFVLNECNVDVLYILLGRMVDGLCIRRLLSTEGALANLAPP